jgi:ABC-type multidrug transport system fused ATPase/permease subunit
VRDNLAYGRPDATLVEIEAAARLASIHSMIMGLPHGYDTVIGESRCEPFGGREAASDDCAPCCGTLRS